MITGTVLFVGALFFYGACLARLFAKSERYERHRELGLLELLDLNASDSRTELLTRAGRRRRLLFDASDDPGVEGARRDALAAMAILISLLFIGFPLGLLLDQSPTAAGYGGPLGAILVAAPIVVALAWGFVLAREMTRPSARPIAVVVSLAGILASATAVWLQAIGSA